MEQTNPLPRTLADLSRVEYLLNVKPNEKPQAVANSWYSDVFGFKGECLCSHLFTEKTVRVYMAMVVGMDYDPVFLKWETLL
jgi:hypothetical protein